MNLVLYKRFFCVSALFCLLMLYSCSSDIHIFGDDSSKAQIVVTVPSDVSLRSADSRSSETDEESLINNLTVLVFNSNTGNKEYSVRISSLTTSTSEVDMSEWESSGRIKLIGSSILSNLSTSRDIHVVANISGDKLANVTTESELDSVITDVISEDIPDPDQDHPILMQGSVSNQVFSSDATANISLVRNIAKVEMTINTTNYTFGGKTVKLLPNSEDVTVRAYNCADRSYVVPQSKNPQSVKYFKGSAMDITPTTRGDSTTQSFSTSYINENVRTSYSKDSTVTSFIIQIPYQVEGGAVQTDNYYRVLVNQDNGYKINRNTIYDLTVNITTLGGETDASAPLVKAALNVLPWDETTIYSNLSQTYLTVKKTSLNIGTRKDFYYATNATSSESSLTTGASWLTASFDGDNNIKLTASGTDYTGARSTTFTIKVNNLSKKITVNQVPEAVSSGSISLSPRAIYLSEVATTKTVGLTVSSSEAPWMLLSGNQSIATCNASSGTGSSTLTFTHGSTYGNSYFKFLDKETMEYDSVKVCNLYLNITSETLLVPSAGGSYTEPVTVSGGDASWYVKSSPSWITSVRNSSGELAFTVTAKSDETERTGSIVIAHVNDPNYTKTLNIAQSPNYIRFADFDYLLITYDWSNSTGRDLDTGTEFMGTNISSIDSQPVGWSLGSTVYDTNSKLVLAWGGDNQALAGSENLVVYMENLTSPSNLTTMRNNGVRYIYINLYATWYAITDYNTPIILKLKSYIGGKMVKSSTTTPTNTSYGTYTNSGGALDVSWSGERLITTYRGVSSFRTSYTKMGVIRYDIEKNEAVASIASSSTSSSVSATSLRSMPLIKSSSSRVVDPPIRSGETKEEYGRRLHQYSVRRSYLKK